MFSDVHLVFGSPLHLSNLEETNVSKCSMCIILTALYTSVGHDQAITDKEAMLCSPSIKKWHNKHVQILTNLNHKAVQFLDLGDEDQSNERIYKAQPLLVVRHSLPPCLTQLPAQPSTVQALSISLRK